MRFAKYEALGNDYLVIEAEEFGAPPAPPAPLVRRLCDRHRGVGADGILVGSRTPDGLTHELRIFNSDGSEAEKSGNGLRIFARYLWDRGLVNEQSFSVHTAGGDVDCRVEAGGQRIAVEMGRVSFHSRDVPVAGKPREVLREKLEIEGGQVEFSAAGIGNPHCVILCERLDEDRTRALGPQIESDERFPNRTNVQFVQVGTRDLRVQIWERGAGFTLASGSSACAAAAVVRRLGLCSERVRVHMPGGELVVEVREDFRVRLTGPAVSVAKGRIAEELLRSLG